MTDSEITLLIVVGCVLVFLFGLLCFRLGTLRGHDERDRPVKPFQPVQHHVRRWEDQDGYDGWTCSCGARGLHFNIDAVQSHLKEGARLNELNMEVANRYGNARN